MLVLSSFLVLGAQKIIGIWCTPGVGWLKGKGREEKEIWGEPKSKEKDH